MPERAFVAQIGQAGVFIYHNAPGRKVFVDGRLEVFGHVWFERFEWIQRAMAAGDPGWEGSLADERGALPVVILDTRHCRPQIAGLRRNPRWRLVFAEPAAAVFLDRATADGLGLAEADPTPLLERAGQ
jgi:hypothetical protein